MSTCEECGFDWDALGPADLIAFIRSGPSLIVRALDEIADERLRTRPAPAVWSPLEYAGHLGDVFAWYGERVRRMLDEDVPQLAALSWAEETDRRHYHDRSVEDILVRLDVSLRRFATMLEPLERSQWARAGVGSEGGERTVLGMARRGAHELQHHVLDLRRAAGGGAG